LLVGVYGHRKEAIAGTALKSFGRWRNLSGWCRSTALHWATDIIIIIIR